MELNEEQVKKALDWLDSLVGNSNDSDSDTAMLTYQLLGILYDTCEELTEANEQYQTENMVLSGEVERLTEENERLRSSSVDYRNIPDIKAETRADTVREIIQRIKEDAKAIFLLSDPPKIMLEIREDALDQIEKEMLEEN